MERCGGDTFARFFLHSVQALGVTTPRPRRRLAAAELERGPGGCGGLGVVEAVDEESPVWAVAAGVAAVEWPLSRGGGGGGGGCLSCLLSAVMLVLLVLLAL